STSDQTPLGKHSIANTALDKIDSTTKPPSRKATRRCHAQHILRLLDQQQDAFLDKSIAIVEQERTAITKANTTMPQRQAIDANHKIARQKVSLQQGSRNLGYTIGSCVKRATEQLTQPGKHVSFATTRKVRVYQCDAAPTVLATLDSGTNGHYISESDWRKANLPILRPSTKRVGVTNGGCSTAKHVTVLPLPQLSPQATRADTFEDFLNSLISVGCLAEDNTISIFTKDGMSVHKEQDILITCRGDPILIGVRDKHGRYQKHVLDNEITETMKNHIKDTYKFTVELVPPGCHCRNAAKDAIRNFKAHFLSILAGTPDFFSANLWD
ncbi:hypothetical protein ACHAW6_003334, partial [Cyclotella cf. meneghiniana]